MVNKSGTKARRGDFALKIESFVEAGENTGYMCQIRREMDLQERLLKKHYSITVHLATMYNSKFSRLK